MEVVSGSGRTGQVLGAAQGVVWWRESWALFKREPLMWIAFLLVGWILSVVLGWFPLVGRLMAAVGSTILAGGWVIAARKAERGEPLEINDLFAGFALALPGLATVGAVLAVIGWAIDAALGLAGLDVHLDAISLNGRDAMALLPTLLHGVLAVLVSVLLQAFFQSLLWFAVPLVALDGVPPVEAMRASVDAVLHNLPAFTVYGLVALAALFVLVPLTLGLALLVLMPMGTLAMYASHRDVFDRRR